MNQARWTGVTVACGLLVASCGSAPNESGPEDAALAATSQALDASCTLTVRDIHGDVNPNYGGSLSVWVLGQCADQAALEYRFSVKDPKNHALPAQDFSPYPGNNWTFSPGALEGTYAVTIEARRVGSTDTAAKVSVKQALGRVCSIAGPSLSPDFALPGAQVLVLPFLWCPSGIVGQWSTTITKPGGGSVTLPWTTNADATWDTTGILPGTATVQVAVRNLGNSVTDATSKVSYVLGEACRVATLTATGSGPSRQLTASATCSGSATPSYAFSVLAPDGTASDLRDFSADPSFTWDTTGLDGTFNVRVDVRAEQSPTQPLTTKSLKVAVGDACTKVTLSDTWGTQQRAEPLTLVASVACARAELSFQVRSVSESTWTTVCPYSAQTSCSVDLTTRPAGDYVARALVRNAGSIATSDAASAARDFVLLDGSALLRALPGQTGISGSAISPDGRWIAGTGFRWSRTNGYIELPDLGANVSGTLVTAVTHAGLVVGGVPGHFENQAVLWNGSNITQILPPTGYATYAYGVSADGKAVVGDGTRGGLAAFRWTAKTGVVDIGGGFWLSGARDVSADGSVVAGYGSTGLGANAVATRWTASTGMVALPLLAGCTTGEARSISQDGKVIVGECWAPGIDRGYRWSAENGLEDLGAFPGGSQVLSTYSTNGDGSVIVGNVVIDNQAISVIWKPSTGFRFLSDVLQESGTDLAGWTLDDAFDVTTDGKTILGYGNRGGYLITLP